MMGTDENGDLVAVELESDHEDDKDKNKRATKVGKPRYHRPYE